MKQYTTLFFVALFLCFSTIEEVKAGDVVKTAGDVLMVALPTTAFGLTNYYRDREGALQFGKSIILTTGVTYGLKYTVNEDRPNGGRYSFPSFHSSISFSAAEFIRKRYGWDYGLPSYIAASFVAYSRVESDQHYIHDVAAGAGIGIISSYLFTKPYKHWYIQADADSKYYGIRLSRSW